MAAAVIIDGGMDERLDRDAMVMVDDVEVHAGTPFRYLGIFWTRA